MSFTAGNVTVPAPGGGAVLVYQTSDSVPTDVLLAVPSGGSVWLLGSSGQTPTTGFQLDASGAVRGLVGAIYAAGFNASYVLSYAASNVE